MRQVDFICGNCPLETCDEESLWCLFRFITDPNDAQKKFSKQAVKRGKYQSNYYQENREKKLAAANLRNQRLKSGEISA
jgi:hypothetical protein